MRVLAVILAALISLTFSTHARAQVSYTVTIVEDLSFGTFVKTDNLAATLTIGPDNSITQSGNIVRFVNGHRAEVMVDGLAPNQEITVDVSFSPYLGGASQSLVKLTIDDVTILPSTIRAQSNGRAVFYVGARLHSDVATPNGMNEVHSGNITITVTPVP
ncbi:DUF4402 domain-containing protein [Woodsholea maritima]|uniref:DUF4402 domain-containing protein n=1 Tax=Woodsholea maritima TaxID=240237 RepID=UPI000A04C675|nr:DUF4402 domain-containing protein [Woodsholea maritima]